MPDDDMFEKIQARQRLEEINSFILHNEGELMAAAGKLSLVWTDETWNIQRFLSIKLGSDEVILINGRRYPATQTGLKEGLLACLKEIRQS